MSTDVLLACATLVPASRAGDPLPFEERVWKARRAVRKPLIIPSVSAKTEGTLLGEFNKGVTCNSTGRV